MKQFIFAMLKRALHTFCQTALGFLTIGAALNEIDWLKMISVAAVAAIYSVVKSIAVGVPEVDYIEE